MPERAIQWDRLYLWLAGLFPLVLMYGALLLPHLRKVSARRRTRALLITALLWLAVIVFVFFDVYRNDYLSAHVHLQDPRLLWLVVPLVSLLLWIQNYTLSGVSRGRMWTAYLLRSAAIVLLLLAFAG